MLFTNAALSKLAAESTELHKALELFNSAVSECQMVKAANLFTKTPEGDFQKVEPGELLKAFQEYYRLDDQGKVIGGGIAPKDMTPEEVVMSVTRKKGWRIKAEAAKKVLIAAATVLSILAGSAVVADRWQEENEMGHINEAHMINELHKGLQKANPDVAK